MKRQLLIMLLAVCCMAGGWAQPFRVNRQALRIEGIKNNAPKSGQDYLYVDNFSIATGQTMVIPVYVHSSKVISLLQCDVVLPNGITASDVSFSDNFLASQSSSGFSVQSGMVDGKFRILVYNATKSHSIPSSDRYHLLDLTITAAETLTPQTQLTLTLNEFYFVEGGTDANYEGGSSSATITVLHALAESVTIEPETVECYVGQKVTLQAHVLPTYAKQDVTWSCSNPGVATVDGTGKVTAVSAGTAIVIASTTDGSNLAATCVVRVQVRLAESIELSSPTLTLEQGTTATLFATVLPEITTNKAVTWATSNAAVATVNSNGRITAVVPGKATITATTTDGSNISATCEVTVTPILVKGVTLDATSAQVTIGYSRQLIATVTPSNAANRQLVWTTSCDTVATVTADGLVSGIGLGTATITATTTDGSNIAASCQVEVVPVYVSEILLDNTSLQLFISQKLRLNAVVNPQDATIQKLQWSSSDESVATVDASGLVVAVAPGEAVITAAATDGGSTTASCALTVMPVEGNFLTAEPATVVRGNEVILPIAMINESEISAVQADLYLTEGITIANDEWGEPDVYLDAERKARDHELSCNAIGTCTRILISSPTAKAFKGNVGTLFYIHLIVDKDLDEGIYMVALRNITLSSTAGERIKADDVETTLGVQRYVRGDANGDNYVDVADYLTTANYIMYKHPFPFFFKAADVLNDGLIDVADLVGIINIGLERELPANASSAPRRAPTATAERLYIENFGIEPGEQKMVSILLNNENAYSALQCDIVMPDGLTIDTEIDDGETVYVIDPTSRCRNHVVSTNQLSDGSVRVWLTSQGARIINGTSGAVLTMSVTAADNFAGAKQLKLRNVVCAKETEDSAGERVELPDAVCTVTAGGALVGDADGNGKVDINDVNAVINIILENKPASFYAGQPDVDGNGKVDIDDMNLIINTILAN